MHSLFLFFLVCWLVTGVCSLEGSKEVMNFINECVENFPHHDMRINLKGKFTQACTFLKNQLVVKGRTLHVLFISPCLQLKKSCLMAGVDPSKFLVGATVSEWLMILKAEHGHDHDRVSISMSPNSRVEIGVLDLLRFGGIKKIDSFFDIGDQKVLNQLGLLEKYSLHSMVFGLEPVRFVLTGKVFILGAYSPMKFYFDSTKKYGRAGFVIQILKSQMASVLAKLYPVPPDSLFFNFFDTAGRVSFASAKMGDISTEFKFFHGADAIHLNPDFEFATIASFNSAPSNHLISFLLKYFGTTKFDISLTFVDNYRSAIAFLGRSKINEFISFEDSKFTVAHSNDFKYSTAFEAFLKVNSGNSADDLLKFSIKFHSQLPNSHLLELFVSCSGCFGIKNIIFSTSNAKIEIGAAPPSLEAANI